MSPRRFLPSLGRQEAKAAVDRRHSAGPSYAFAGVPYMPVSDLELDRVIRDQYERDVWVFRAVDARAKNAARIDVLVKDGRGMGAAVIDGHRLSLLLNRQPNPYESAYTFRHRLHTLLDLSVTRGVFVEVSERRGEIARLDLLNPMHTYPVPDPDRFVAGFEMRLPTGEVFERLPAYEAGRGGVLWIKRPHPTDPYQSTSWLKAAGLSVDLDYWARRYNLNFLFNDGRPGGVLAVKSTDEYDGLDPADAEILQRRISGGPDVAGTVTLLEADHLEYIDLSTTPRDAQYVEGRAITQREILVAAGTPLSVIGDASGRTFDNADAEFEGFWRTELRPELEMVANDWERLTVGGMLDDSEVVTYDWDSVSVLGRDRREAAARMLAEVQAGVRSIDSYLEATGAEPLDLPGTRVLWQVAGKAPIGDEADVNALLTQGQGPPPQAPAPAPAGGEAPPAALEEGPPGPPPGGGSPSDEDVLDDALYAVKALGAAPEDVVERRRRDHAELIDRWTGQLADEVAGLLRRQQKVVLARLRGAKARRHTRHWDYGAPPTGEMKALDPAYVMERAGWIDQTVQVVAGVVTAAFAAAARETAAALGRPEAAAQADRELVARVVRLIAEGLDARAGRLQEIIAERDAAGDSVDEIAAAVTDAYGSSDTWAEVTSRAVVGAMNGASLITAANAGALAKRWLCVAPDTPVVASGVLDAARRRYEGPLVRVSTASGRVVAVTPQHHVLTGRGWVAAQDVDLGDHLFQVAGTEPAGAPDVEGRPPRIGELIDSAMDAQPVEVRTMPIGVDLDGETVHRQVEVAAADRHLRSDLMPDGAERVRDLALKATDVELGAFAGGSPGGQVLGGQRVPEQALGHPATAGGVDLVGFAGHPHPAGGTLVAERHPGLGEDPAHGGLGAPDADGDRARAVARLVRPDDVVDVEIVAFRGHVYDLSTVGGWYAADGLIVHNSTEDERTRPTHREAEGQVAPLAEPFRVGEGLLLFPGDPTGPIGEVINCRCTMIYALGPSLPEDDIPVALLEEADRIREGEWKAARGFVAVSVRFDPAQHPRDWRGRFLDVPDVVLPDGSAGVAVGTDEHDRVIVAREEGGTAVVAPASLGVPSVESGRDRAPARAPGPAGGGFRGVRASLGGGPLWRARPVGAGDGGPRGLRPGLRGHVRAVREPAPGVRERWASWSADAPDLVELDDSPEAAAEFRAAITAAREAVSARSSTAAHGAAVHVYEPDEYRRMRLLMTPDGSAGVAVTGDGDVVSVFANPGMPGRPRLAAASLVEAAVDAGGTRLDAFDGALPKLYGRHGFRAVARVPFDDSQAPEGWPYDRLGRPDVVLMALDPAAGDYRPGDGARVGSWDEAVAAVDAALEPESPSPRLEAHDYEGEYGNRQHITRVETGTVPTSVVADLPGVAGETPGAHRNRQGERWREFLDDVRENGVRTPIFITVDPGEGPRISEGNHRRDAAVEAGLPEVPVEVRYFGHAERNTPLIAEPDAPSPKKVEPSNYEDDQRWEIPGGLTVEQRRNPDGTDTWLVWAGPGKSLFVGDAEELQRFLAKRGIGDTEPDSPSWWRKPAPPRWLTQRLRVALPGEKPPAPGSYEDQVRRAQAEGVFRGPDATPERWQLARLPDGRYGQVAGRPDAQGMVDVVGLGGEQPVERHRLLDLAPGGPAPFRTGYDLATERHVFCAEGHRHWGAAGAAGILVRNVGSDGKTRYLMQQRAPWVQHGGTWSTPGGAMHLGESPEAAGFREAREELGRITQPLETAQVFTDAHGGWAYHTVVLDAPKVFFPRGSGDREGLQTGWFTEEEIARLDLHPSFRASWPALKARLDGTEPPAEPAKPEGAHLDPQFREPDWGDLLEDPPRAEAAAKASGNPATYAELRGALAAMCARLGVPFDPDDEPSTKAGSLALKPGQAGDGAKARAMIPTVEELIDHGIWRKGALKDLSSPQTVRLTFKPGVNQYGEALTGTVGGYGGEPGDLKVQIGHGDAADIVPLSDIATVELHVDLTPEEAAKEWKRQYNAARFRVREARLKAAKAAAAKVAEDKANTKPKPPEPEKPPKAADVDEVIAGLAAEVLEDVHAEGKKPKALYTLDFAQADDLAGKGLQPGPGAVPPTVPWHRQTLALEDGDAIPVVHLEVKGRWVEHGTVFKLPGAPAILVEHPAGEGEGVVNAAGTITHPAYQRADVAAQRWQRAVNGVNPNVSGLVHGIALLAGPNPADAHWAKVYDMPGFQSAATGGDHGIYFWDTAPTVGVMAHEFGHNVDVFAPSSVPWQRLTDSPGPASLPTVPDGHETGAPEALLSWAQVREADSAWADRWHQNLQGGAQPRMFHEARHAPGDHEIQLGYDLQVQDEGDLTKGAPTDYAGESTREDFAESVRLYLKDRSLGRLGWLDPDPGESSGPVLRFRDMYPARARYLDTVFGNHPVGEASEQTAWQKHQTQQIVLALKAVTKDKADWVHADPAHTDDGWPADTDLRDSYVVDGDVVTRAKSLARADLDAERVAALEQEEKEKAAAAAKAAADKKAKEAAEKKAAEVKAQTEAATAAIEAALAEAKAAADAPAEPTDPQAMKKLKQRVRWVKWNAKKRKTTHVPSGPEGYTAQDLVQKDAKGKVLLPPGNKVTIEFRSVDGGRFRGTPSNGSKDPETGAIRLGFGSLEEFDPGMHAAAGHTFPVGEGDEVWTRKLSATTNKDGTAWVLHPDGSMDVYAEDDTVTPAAPDYAPGGGHHWTAEQVASTGPQNMPALLKAGKVQGAHAVPVAPEGAWVEQTATTVPVASIAPDSIDRIDHEGMSEADAQKVAEAYEAKELAKLAEGKAAAKGMPGVPGVEGLTDQQVTNLLAGAKKAYDDALDHGTWTTVPGVGPHKQVPPDAPASAFEPGTYVAAMDGLQWFRIVSVETSPEGQVVLHTKLGTKDHDFIPSSFGPSPLAVADPKAVRAAAKKLPDGARVSIDGHDPSGPVEGVITKMGVTQFGLSTDNGKLLTVRLLDVTGMRVASPGTPQAAAAARHAWLLDEVRETLLHPGGAPGAPSQGAEAWSPALRKKAAAWLHHKKSFVHPLAQTNHADYGYGGYSQAKANIAAEIGSRLNNEEDWEVFRRYRHGLGGEGYDKYGQVPYNIGSFGSYTQEARQKILDQEVSNRIGNWADSSGDSHPFAIAIQRGIEEEFGTGGNWNPHHMPLDIHLSLQQSGAHATFTSMWENGGREFFRRFVRRMWENTQDQLAAEGVTEVCLYRGMNGYGEHFEWSTPGTHPVTDTMPGNSWTTSVDKAIQFGGGSNMLVGRFPASRILGSARTGFGCWTEWEFAVLTGPGNITVYKGHGYPPE